MDLIRQYILSVTAAAMVCGIIVGMTQKNSAHPILKLVCGLFLAFTVIKPITEIDLMELVEVSLPYSQDAVQAASWGEKLSRDATVAIIKEKAEAYILDKAAARNVTLEVEITVDGDPPVPTAVRLSGEVSPYAKQELVQILSEDLGIPKENQQWTG